VVAPPTAPQPQVFEEPAEKPSLWDEEEEPRLGIIEPFEEESVEASEEDLEAGEEE